MFILKSYLSLAKCYDIAHRISSIISPAIIPCFTLGLVWSLFIAPTDFQQGQAYRIIYLHVPSAILSLNLYFIMGILALGYLIWRIKIFSLLIQCLAKVGIVFSGLALVTGSIWGKPMWGTWWIWDARLTSTLILFFLYLGILALNRSITQSRAKDSACAVLTLIGTVNIPIIHYSVVWWNTLHQGATITQFWAPKIDHAMLKPLIYMLLCYIMYVIVVVSNLLIKAIAERESHTQWLKKRLLEDVF